MRKIISSLLAFIIFCGLCSGTAYADDAEKTAELPDNTAEDYMGEDYTDREIKLKYDDRYTFPDAQKVEAPEEGPIEVSGKTIRAAGITYEPVTVSVDGEIYSVTVEKAPVVIFVIDGQSNAWGSAGRHDKNAIAPDKGCGYFWSGGSLRDANEYVKAFEKTAPRMSVGVWPALAAEWYALTGEKAVVLNIAQSGYPIQHWTSGYSQFGADMIGTCIDSIDEELFNIQGGGYFWFQGESNSDIYETTNQMRYTTTEEYIAEFRQVQDAYFSAFKTRGINAFAGIFTIRNWGNLLGISRTNEYSGPRAAQQYLANSQSDIFMVSSLAESWEKSDKGTFSYTSAAGFEVKIGAVRALYSGVHYNQSGYDIMGLEAADSLYSGWRCGRKADDFILYGQNAKTTYEENSVIYLDDNLRITGVANSGEKFAAQLVAVTLPRGDACSDLSMKLTRCSDGSEVTGVMTDSGYFPDVSAVDEDMNLTVSMGEVSRSYTITKHAHKLSKGAENKKGNFEFTDKNGELIDSSGLGDMVYIRSIASEGCIPTGISAFETVSGKTVPFNDEGVIDGTAVYSFKMPSADVTVKGKYIQPGTDNIGYRFTVTYDKNCEEATGSMKKMSGSIGAKSALAANTFECEGYSFGGWNTAPDGSGTDVEDGAKISEFVIQNYSNITLYAQWKEIVPESEEIPVIGEDGVSAASAEP